MLRLGEGVLQAILVHLISRRLQSDEASRSLYIHMSHCSEDSAAKQYI